MDTLLAQNTAATNTTPPATDKQKQIEGLGYGDFTGLVHAIKTIYTKENEDRTKAADKRLPIREFSKWDAEYMSYYFDVHPEGHDKFAAILVTATEAVKRGKNFTPDEIQALQALKALSDGTKDGIFKLMAMIRDASKMVEERDAQGKPSRWKVERIEREKSATKRNSNLDEIEVPGATLHEKGVKLDVEPKGSDIAGVLAFIQQKAATQHLRA